MTEPVSRREQLARRLPAAFQTCPFEVLIALLTIIVGVSVIFGSTSPGSLLSYLPGLGLKVWGVGLLAGGLTIAAGLPRKTYPIILSAGLGLVGPCLGAYSLAVIAYAGWATGGVSGIFFGAVALLCGFRSFYLGAEADATHRVRTNGGVT